MPTDSPRKFVSFFSRSIVPFFQSIGKHKIFLCYGKSLQVIVDRRFSLNNVKNYDFTLLSLLVIFSEIFYFPRVFAPSHDTMVVFQSFYFFYNELFFHGQLAQWMPYSSFGLSSHYYQLNSLTPLSYLSFLVGLLFEIKDVLILFKVSLVMEKLVFLLGMYLLSRTLFFSRITTAMVCLGALCSSHYFVQLFLDLRIFYMLPLAMYFLVLFFTHKRAEFFWLTGITTIFWAIGSPPYFLTLWFFIYCVVGCAFLFSYRESWRFLFERYFSNILCLGIFLFLLGIYLCQIQGISSSLSLLEGTGRGNSGKNSLGMFLTYGGSLDIKKYLTWLVCGSADISYMGILPLIFAIWSFIWVRTKNFFPFLLGAVVLIWLSVGGIFAAVVFFFPGMVYYRHISLICGLIKIFLLICAGFGLEHFWSVDLKTKFRSLGIVFVVLILVLDVLRITGDQLTYFSSHDEEAIGLLTRMNIDSLAFRLKAYAFVGVVLFVLIWGINFIQRKRRVFGSHNTFNAVIKVGVMCVFFVDVLSVQYYLYKVEQRVSPDSVGLKTMEVHELKFQQERYERPQDERGKNAMAFILSLPGSKPYSVAYNFLQFDPCRSLFREDFFSTDAKGLFVLKDLKEKDFKHISGCEAPKVRLVSDALMLDNSKEVTKFLKNTPVWPMHPILHQSKKNLSLIGSQQKESDLKGIQSANTTGSVHVKRFSANEIWMDADVVSAQGTWLVYADAFHPDWRAVVNGRPTEIYNAYLAFKAIRLASGHNEVRLFFDKSFGVIVSHFLALIGLLGGIISCVMFLGVFVLGYDGCRSSLDMTS